MLSRILRSIPAFFDRLSSAFGFLGANVILLLIAVVCYDVVLRYFFNSPTVWGFETTENLMVLIVCSGLAFALRQGRHIRVDVLLIKLPRKAQVVLGLVNCIFGLILSSIFLRESLNALLWSIRVNEKSPTSLGTPIFVIKGIIVLGLSLLALQFLSEIYKQFQTSKNI